MKSSRVRAEATLRRELRLAIKPELSFLSHAEELLAQLAGESESAGDAPNLVAVSKLLSRTAADLRGMLLLMERGYGLQALTLGASAYEHLCAAAYVGGSMENGREWLDHTDTFSTKSPNYLAPRISKRIKYHFDTVDRGNGKQADAVYTLLCSAKHGNPLIMANLQVVSNSDAHYISASPLFSPEIISQARLAAYATARGMVQTLHVLVEENVICEPTSKQAVRTVELAGNAIENFRRRRSQS